MNLAAPAECHLPATAWRSRMTAHRERALAWTQPMRDRKARGEKHAVLDFLHTYYNVSFGKLEQWHPGIGVMLADGPELPRGFKRAPYTRANGTVQLDPATLPDHKRHQFAAIRNLLRATRDRPPNLACHGLHEWAMVFSGAEVRHRETVPLRLPQVEIDALVTSRPLCCTHYDAFRFFAPATRPRNKFLPDLSTREQHEQAGCIHANMDLYKWAGKAMPWIGSDLLFDCFLFATRCREIDMRASPYDLRSLGYEPIRIETEEGRREYEREQHALMELGRPLRERLIGALKTVAGPSRS